MDGCTTISKIIAFILFQPYGEAIANDRAEYAQTKPRERRPQQGNGAEPDRMDINRQLAQVIIIHDIRENGIGHFP